MCRAGVEPARLLYRCFTDTLAYRCLPTHNQGSGGRTHALLVPSQADYLFPTPCEQLQSESHLQLARASIQLQVPPLQAQLSLHSSFVACVMLNTRHKKA